jgi:hypothetical protein
VNHKVAPSTYAAMVRLFGFEQLVNTCVLTGQYLSTLVLMHTFAQQLPPSVESTLPMD